MGGFEKFLRNESAHSSKLRASPLRITSKRLPSLTGRDQTLLDQEIVVARLNRVLTGWANYFCLGPVSKAYRAVDQHALKRLRQWLCAKHKVVGMGTGRFPEPFLYHVLGLVCLTARTGSLPWATS